MQNRMRSKMMRLGLSLAPVFLWTASTQAAPKTVYFWNSAAGIQDTRAGMEASKTGVWGNGAVEDAPEMRYEGASTLKITTRNFREGARFDLKTPFDIAPYREAGYLRLRLRFREGEREMRNNIAPAAPPRTPVKGGGFGDRGDFGEPDILREPDILEGAQVRGNAQAGVLPPLGGMPNIPQPNVMIPFGPRSQETPITKILCTLILDNGVMEGTIEIPKVWENTRQVDFEKVQPDAAGWLLFSMNLQQMGSTPGASGMVRRMILSADKQDAFYLTQAALVIETGEMSVLIRKINDAPGTQLAEITVRPGALTLVADVEAGAADPSIEWNFDADDVGNLPAPNPDGLPVPPTRADGRVPGEIVDDGENIKAVPFGPRIDARGLIARVVYPDEEQNYRIEVTVRDRAGKKAPVITSILVHVRG